MENVFRIILIIVEVISCLLLIGVILLQQSKSQGMGLAFGGGMGESLFGSRAGNVLTKITIILSIVFLANTTLLGIMYTTSDERSLVEKTAAPAPLPVTAPTASPSDMMTAPPSQQGTLFPTMDEAPASVETQTSEPVVMPVTMTETEVAPAVESEPVAAPVTETP